MAAACSRRGSVSAAGIRDWNRHAFGDGGHFFYRDTRRRRVISENGMEAVRHLALCLYLETVFGAAFEHVDFRK